jgi:hypothetical protein
MALAGETADVRADLMGEDAIGGPCLIASWGISKKLPGFKELLPWDDEEVFLLS